MMPTPEKPSILNTPLKRWFPANLETLLVVLLLLAAVVSRFYNLGAMTITFDEVNHVTPSDSLYSGNGYQYDPMSHGPLQMHMIALSYALFGDNDFTTRIPAATLSVVTIVLALFAFRRYLGRTGALVAGLLFLISPFMLFYGRYARNEAYIVVWGLLTLYAILRHLERGETWSLFLFTAVNALHFTDKATCYMFAAEEFLFLAAYFVERMARREWPQSKRRTSFLMSLMLAMVLAAGAAGLYLTQKPLVSLWLKIGVAILAVGGVGALVWSGVELVRSFGWAGLRSERALNLLIMLGTFLLPLMGAIPISWLGYTALDYTVNGVVRVGVAAGLLGAVGVALGLWWFGRKWLLYAAVFFVPFVLLYSTFFTSPEGLVGGLVGMLSYWLGQHDIQRVYQPFFYYPFIEIPMYEFLPALGTVTAVVIASVKRLWQSQPGQPFTPAASDQAQPPVPVAALLVFWSVSSLAVFTYAGEKAPWLTVHIALPLILSAAWALGWMIEAAPWGRLAAWGTRNYLRVAALAFFGLLAVLTGRAAYRAAYINYNTPLEYLVYAHHSAYPKVVFNEIEELSLRITGGTDMVVAYDNNVRYPYWWYMRYYPNKMDFGENPTRDVRNAPVIVVSDANDAKLTSVVRDNYVEFKYPRIWWQNMDYWSVDWKSIASERSAALSSKYAGTGTEVPPMTVFEYLKYVWPHIKPFFTDAKVRSAVWQIWFNRDYTEWAALRNSDSYTLTNWAGAQYMYAYIRKDIAAQLWPYGATAQQVTQPSDPYASITTPVTPDLVLGQAGSAQGQFQGPRALALAPDGSLYVADSLNNRIQHIAPDGQVLQAWGTFADAATGNAPGGTFNEPWGVAVAPDGSVYVADTWNYRIQKFTSDGQFVKMWGFGPAMGQDGFYGPRGLAVDSLGRLFVADTGNKRIVIFDADGNYLAEFGTPGMSLGQLDEPVAVALDASGNVYVTDTWNQRIQVFAPDADKLVYTATDEWPVEGWYGNSLENKPFITVDGTGTVSVTDPEVCRVISFSSNGQPVRVWDGCAAGAFSRPSGIASDGAGGLWVTDATNGTLIHFKTEIANP
jgi:predicted membrane-bound mannosyltransferase/sugar lactone lactonase YvrE